MDRETGKNKGKILGVIFLLIFACAYGGVNSVKNLLFSLINVIKQVALWIWQIFVGFLPYLDFADWIICAIVFFVILFVASISGTVYSAKQKNKLWTVICTAFDIITLLGAIFSASHLK